MKKYFTLKKITLVLGLIFLGLQFIRIDKTNPPVNSAHDFVTVTKAPQNIADMLHRSCYDCHSNQTEYPWYSNIAPISWILKNHIDEGREELNFSEWAAMSGKEMSKKMKEAAEEVNEGEMPISSYTWLHSNARLSAEEVSALAAYFQSQIGATQGNSEGDDD